MKPQPKTLVWLAVLLLWSYGVHGVWSRYAPPVPSRVVRLDWPDSEVRFIKDGQLGVCRIAPPPLLEHWKPNLRGPMQYWDLKTGQKVRELFSEDDVLYPTIRNSNAILLRNGEQYRVFDVLTGEELDTFQETSAVSQATLSPHRQCLIVETSKAFRVRDLRTHRESWSKADICNAELWGENIVTGSTIFQRHPNGNITISSDRKCFDTKTGQPLEYINRFGSMNGGISMTPDGGRLLCSILPGNNQPPRQYLIDPVDQKVLWESATLPSVEIIDNETMMCLRFRENRFITQRYRLSDQSLISEKSWPSLDDFQQIDHWVTNSECVLCQRYYEHWTTRSKFSDLVCRTLRRWMKIDASGQLAIVLYHPASDREIARHPRFDPYVFVDDQTYAFVGRDRIEYFSIPPRRDPWWLGKALVATAIPGLGVVGIAKWRARWRRRRELLAGSSPETGQ